MQSALSTGTHHVTRSRTTPLVIALLVLSLLVAMTPAASGQEATPDAAASPIATPAADVTIGATPAAEADALGTVLMRYEFEEMPEAPMTVRLLRITLAPGASVPMHTHPGIEFDEVVFGTVTASTNDTMIVNRNGEQAEVSETVTLEPGSWVMYPEGSGMSFTNEGDEDVVLLSAVILSVGGETDSTITYTEGEPTDEDFEGVSFVVLGDGLIQQFPDGPATVIVDVLNLAAGEPVPPFSGAALISKQAGTLAFAVDEGQVQVTRTDTPQLQPNAIPGQEFTLNDNDAAFFPSGYEAIERPESDSDLALLRLLILPEADLANGVASVSTIQVEETAEGAEPAEPGDGLGVGAVIALTEDLVNVRADATTDSEIVDTFPAGTQFEIIGGPVEGEDYTWYQVRGVGDLADVEGWLVTEFMDVVEPATGETQVPDEGTIDPEDVVDALPVPSDVATEDIGEEPDATPAPVTPPAGEIEVGATVETTDDNVRIRAEGNAGSDILAALPAGTQLEVIGGPEEADAFTWVEVEVVENGLTGWTAVDFLEVVEPAP